MTSTWSCSVPSWGPPPTPGKADEQATRMSRRVGSDGVLPRWVTTRAAATVRTGARSQECLSGPVADRDPTKAHCAQRHWRGNGRGLGRWPIRGGVPVRFGRGPSGQLDARVCRRSAGRSGSARVGNQPATGNPAPRCRSKVTATLRPATALPEVRAYGSTANSLPVSESRKVHSGLSKLTTGREMGSLVGVTVDNI
jgi:hypothetical protein